MKLSAALHSVIKKQEMCKLYKPCSSQPLIKPHRPAEGCPQFQANYEAGSTYRSYKDSVPLTLPSLASNGICTPLNSAVSNHG